MYRQPKMQAETDSTVRDLVPGLLEAAGMAPEAEEMRRVDMFSATCVAEATAILQRVREEASGRWAPLLREACFWAEAMIWAAWEGDGDAFDERQERLGQAVTDGLASMTMH